MIDLNTTTKKHLNVTEVAEIAGVTRKTIYNWINAGKLPYVRVFEHSPWMIPTEAVRTLFAPRTMPDSSESYTKSTSERPHTT